MCDRRRSPDPAHPNNHAILKKSKRGRPKLKPEVRKSRLAAVRVTAPEFKLFERAAAASGESLPDWMRTALVTKAKRELRIQ
jgi:hypothetical protein